MLAKTANSQGNAVLNQAYWLVNVQRAYTSYLNLYGMVKTCSRPQRIFYTAMATQSGKKISCWKQRMGSNPISHTTYRGLAYRQRTRFWPLVRQFDSAILYQVLLGSELDSSLPNFYMRIWRNWQTRYSQKVVSFARVGSGPTIRTTIIFL